MTPLLLLASVAFADPATIARCPDAPPALPEAMNETLKRVVRIETPLGTGSGVVISPDGYVLTASHVVMGAVESKVVFSDETTMTGTLVRAHTGADLALLHVPGVGLPCLPLAEERLAPAADTWIVGSPGGKELTGSVTRGIVSSYRDREGWTVVQTDASMNPGNSGGPLLGAGGKVQGIVSFKVMAVGAEGLGFAVAAEAVPTALDIVVGEASDAEIAPNITTAAGVVTPFAAAPPEITKAPATRGPMPKGNVCAYARTGEDPFSGEATFEASGADLFSLSWKTGQDPVLTMNYPLRHSATGMAEIAANPAAYGPGGITLDIKLEDGTVIHLVSDGADAQWIGLSPVVATRFVINREVALAIASSGPTWLRWTAAGSSTPVDQERSSRQRDKYYRPVFACLAQKMPE